MTFSEKPTISESIEQTVEGVLRFGLRFLRTTWVIFRHPLKVGELLLDADPTNKEYVLPLSYLTLGGFIFTLVISAYPFGLLNIVDLIWFDKEITSILHKRGSEALSVAGLITAAFPVFISVILLASLGSRIFEKERRVQFQTLNYYLFGYQTLLFFFMFFVFIASDLVSSTLVGPYSTPTWLSAFSDMIADVVLLALLVLFLSPVFTPIAALTHWQAKTYLSSRTVGNAVRLALIPVYAISVLLVVSYVASLPAAFQSMVKTKPPTIAIDTIGDNFVSLTVQSDGSAVASVSANLVIDNKPSDSLYVETRDIGMSLVLEHENKPHEQWHAQSVSVREGASKSTFVAVNARSMKIYPISGSINLPESAMQLMREKAAGTESSNEYLFLLSVDLGVNGNKYNRSTAFDASTAIIDQ